MLGVVVMGDLEKQSFEMIDFSEPERDVAIKRSKDRGLFFLGSIAANDQEVAIEFCVEPDGPSWAAIQDAFVAFAQNRIADEFVRVANEGGLSPDVIAMYEDTFRQSAN